VLEKEIQQAMGLGNPASRPSLNDTINDLMNFSSRPTGPPTLVRIREVNGTEVFESKYGEGNLVAEQGIDFVVIPVDGADPYPCKIDIFHKTWEETEKDSGIYRRKELCKCITIPEETTVTLETLEGTRVVSHPNYIALGIEGEVYSYSPEWVGKNLEFIDAASS
jgi:hypothetical protein